MGMDFSQMLKRGRIMKTSELSIEDQKTIVKEIRQKTGYETIQVIKALRECNWDSKEAINLLRKYNGYTWDRILPK